MWFLNNSRFFPDTELIPGSGASKIPGLADKLPGSTQLRARGKVSPNRLIGQQMIPRI